MALPNLAMSFSPFAILTAEEMNDLVENIEALSDGSGLADGAVTPNKLDTGADAAYTANAGTTTSTSYTSTLTSGGTNPAVTVTVGANGLALVSVKAGLANSGADGTAWVSFAVSGASTVAASDANAVNSRLTTATATQNLGFTLLLTGLTPGSTTFTMQYRTGSNTGTFSNRHLAVVPL